MPDPLRPISEAPRDGRPVIIQGLRFMTDEPYEAVAVWATRRCPHHETTGWFPPTDKHDGEGDYSDVTHFREVGDG